MSRSGSEQNAVVVPAISTGSSLACIRSLGRRGIHTIAVSENQSPPSVHSKYCHEFRRVSSPQTDFAAYKGELLDLARRSDVLTIVPLRELDIYLLSKYRSEFDEHISTPWSPFERVQRVQDRAQLFEAAARADVPTPASMLADEWTDWDRASVVKSRYSILVEDGTPSYPGVRFFGPGDAPDVEALAAEMKHVPLAQEYVPGDREYGFFALYDEGEPVTTFQHRRIRSYNYTGGASVFRKSVHVPTLHATGTRLLDELDWHGPAMVEFKRDPRDGQFKLMEINPRFWGSLPLAVASGVDFPYYYYQLASGDESPLHVGQSESDDERLADERPALDYETDVGCHILHGEVSYLHSLLTDEYSHIERPAFLPEFFSVVGSLLTDPHFDYLDVGDPRPFISMFTSASKHGINHLRNWTKR